MTSFLKRNLMVFFKDRAAVFFSLLTVFIIIGLYALFLGNVWLGEFPKIDGARALMDSWLIAGLLATTLVTTTLGALGVMVEDKANKITKDFYSAPLKRSAITGGYLLSVFTIGVIMSLVALTLSEVYIVINGGVLLSALAAIKTLGIILLSTLSSTAMMCFIVSFFMSQNAFFAVSTIVGTLVGFVAGIYLPVGTLPEAVQTVVKVFPVSHAAALLRQTVMGAPMDTAFTGAPQQALDEFNSMMGVSYKLGDFTVTPLMSIAFLALTGILFYGLAMMRMSKKRA